MDSLSSTARLICSKQATFIHRLDSKCFQDGLQELSPQALAQRTVGNAIVAMHIRVCVEYPLRPLATGFIMFASPLQHQNLVSYKALLGLLCSDKFRYEIPLNMYCFCTECSYTMAYLLHAYLGRQSIARHNETTRLDKVG